MDRGSGLVRVLSLVFVSAFCVVSLCGVASADSARVVAKKHGSVDVLLRAGKADRCTLTVHRGSKTIRKRVALRGKVRKRVKIAIRGKGTATVRVKCRSARRRGKRPHLSPYDLIIVKYEYRPRRIRIYKGTGDRDRQLLHDVFLHDPPGWSDTTFEVSAGTFETPLQPLSGDFSKLLFQGVRDGETGQHIGVLDLVTGKARDLTEGRQRRRDPTDPPLCEHTPSFVSQSSPVAGNSLSTIRFWSGTGTLSSLPGSCGSTLMTSSLTSPNTITAFPVGALHPQGRVEASADGRWLYSGSYVADQVTPPPGGGFYSADGTRQVPVDCVPDVGDGAANQRREFLLAWTGPRTVALGVFGTTEAAVDWRTATLNDDGSVTCAGGLPATIGAVSDLWLSYDGRAILFSTQGPNGIETYRQKLAGGEPRRASYPALSSEIWEAGYREYRVGPTLP